MNLPETALPTPDNQPQQVQHNNRLTIIGGVLASTAVITSAFAITSGGESAAPVDSTTTTTIHSDVDTTPLPPPTELTITTTSVKEPTPETTTQKNEVLANPEVETPKYGTVDIFGDSIVNGYHSGTKRWSDIIQEKFKSFPEYMGVTIRNHAIPAEAILNNFPEWKADDSQVMGGNLLAKIMQTYPEDTPKENLPNMAILVPSANQFVFSELKTTQEKIDAGIGGLKMAVAYLEKMGVKVVVTDMLQTTERFDNGQKDAFNKNIAEFNKTLHEQKNLTFLEGYSLDDTNDGVAEPSYFTDKNGNFDNDSEQYNEGLHPTKKGHEKLATRIMPALRKLIQKYLPMAF